MSDASPGDKLQRRGFEQNLEIIKIADWIINPALGLDPRVGPEGASIPAARKPVPGLDPGIAAGPPEAIVKEAAPVGRPVRRSSEGEGGSPKAGEGRSYTGQFLKPALSRRPARRRVEAAE